MATVIYTKALKPGVAIVMSGILNFVGAVVVGTAVALAITRIIPRDTVTLTIVISVLAAAVMWNLFTWWFGLPVSSSHCLIGALMGAGVAANGLHGVTWHELTKVIIALFVSPPLGFAIGALVTWVTMKLSKEKEREKEKLANNRPQHPTIIRFMHIFSSASVSFSHGSNDGQKTMGIITLVLATHFAAMGYKADIVPVWVIIAAATASGAGTIIGCWRVIRTIGTKISRERLSHAQGFGASLSTAFIIMVASRIGAPISTTHTLVSAVAGATIPAHGIKKLNTTMLSRILSAWVLTLPMAASLAALSYFILRYLWHP